MGWLETDSATVAGRGTRVEIPTYKDLMYPTLVAVQRLGGSAAIAELEELVPEILGLTEEQIALEKIEEDICISVVPAPWLIDLREKAALTLDNRSASGDAVEIPIHQQLTVARFMDLDFAWSLG